MTEVSQARLLARHREGDPTAFGDLVRAHQGPLLRLARGLLGAGEACEDVVQEAFLRLAQHPPETPVEALGDPRLEHAQLSSWLHKVTRNLCMDVLRSETRRRKRERAVASVEASDGGQSAVDAADTRALVEEKLQRLPLDQREVLVLRLLGEKSYREIAAITGKKIGTVGWLVSVGLKALSAELTPFFQSARTGPRPAAAPEPELGFGMVQGELS